MSLRTLRFLCRLCPAVTVTGTAFAASLPEFELAPGFEISVYSTDQLAHNITAMTVDSRGRVVVAGPGYIKTLLDEDQDGVADRAVLFSRVPTSGAQGLCATADGLLASGDKSILRLRDADGDGVADGAPEILRGDQDDREHGTHAIKVGPDGWYYVMIGNAAAAGAYRGLTSDSPVRQPRQGALMRFSPDFRQVEAVAHGFRNAYDFDFTADGRILTVDSDGERVHHLPGYAATRLFDVAIGGHHGWMVRASPRSWSREPYFVDTVERAVELGRGSPTGVLSYRHTQFPTRYRAGVFSACWSFGTVYFLPLQERGATFDATREVFLQAKGNDGFAPSALAVNPDGDLLVAIGGRSTRGGVYRIRYVGAVAVAKSTSTLDAVLHAPQPLSSWSRTQWMPLAKDAGQPAFESVALARERPAAQRVRAIEILIEVYGALSPDLARQLAEDAEPAVVARLAWALERNTVGSGGHNLLARLTRHPSPLVQRVSWESLLGTPDYPDSVAPDWEGGVTSPERRVRSAAFDVARRRGVRDFKGSAPRVELARLRLTPPDYGDAAVVRSYFERALDVYNRVTDPGIRREAVELMQIGLGDISLTEDRPEWCDIGYSGIYREKVERPLRESMAAALLAGGWSGPRELVTERARLLGMLQEHGREATDAIARLWTAETSPADDLHFLLVSAQIPGARSDDTLRRTAHALASLHGKMDAREWLPSTYWPVRLSEMFQRLLRLEPRLADALAADPDFGHADHSLFALTMSGPAKEVAVRRLLATAERSRTWNAGLIELVAESLPAAETKPALRRLRTDATLREAVAVGLARDVETEDREFLLESLVMIQAPAVAKIAPALSTPVSGSSSDFGRMIKALARHEREPAAANALHDALTRWAGAEGGAKSPTFKAWLEWFAQRDPARAADLRREQESDPAEVLSQLQGVAWGLGNVEQGRKVYQERGCFSCHEGARLGPELKGIASRFSREDLFLHIVKPNLAISPAYRALQVTMRDGTMHIGEAVYDSPEALLLEIAPGNTIRLTSRDILRVEPSRRSPMPERLLDGLKRAELADLYAYLRTLK